ncbi:MAG: putative amidohydrolase [Gammaproteobacteria bacterium]|jgi:predicted amidohydrolase
MSILMKIAIYQLLASDSSSAARVSRLHTCIKQAAATGVELVIFPELALSGYNVGAELITNRAETRDGIFAQSIAALAKDNAIAVAYGYPERDGDRLYNSAALVDAGGVLVLNYRKTHLFGDYERKLFSAGSDPNRVAKIGDWSISLLICYDIEFPEAARLVALRGADLIIVPTALMAPYDRIPNLLIPARAYENQLYVAYANYCGVESNLNYCGKSTIACPDGAVYLQAEDSETIIVGELSRDVLRKSRELNTYLEDRRPEIYAPLALSR